VLAVQLDIPKKSSAIRLHFRNYCISYPIIVLCVGVLLKTCTACFSDKLFSVLVNFVKVVYHLTNRMPRFSFIVRSIANCHPAA